MKSFLVLIMIMSSVLVMAGDSKLMSNTTLSFTVPSIRTISVSSNWNTIKTEVTKEGKTIIEMVTEYDIGSNTPGSFLRVSLAEPLAIGVCVFLNVESSIGETLGWLEITDLNTVDILYNILGREEDQKITCRIVANEGKVVENIFFIFTFNDNGM